MLKYFTLREWKYLTSVFNIRSGYDNFLPDETDRVVDTVFHYKPNLVFNAPEDKKAFYDKSLNEYTDEDFNCIDLDLSKVYVPKLFWRNYKQYLNIDGYIGHKFDNDYADNYNAFDNPHARITKFEIKAPPREEQIPLFELVEKKLQSFYIINGIIQAAPGYGKTFSSLKLISNIKLRGLIVVPNDVLLNQWKEAILKFSNLKEDEIGILQGSDPEFLLRESQKEVNIVIINSLYSQIKRLGHDFVYSLYKDIGIVFYDEAHVSGAAESFSKTSCIFLTNNIIGLTATPYRKGLNEFLLNNCMGGMLYISDHQNLIPEVFIHNCHIVTDQKTIDKLNFFRNDYIRFLTMYNSMLFNNDAYFDYLASWIVFRVSQGHKVAILFATNKMIFKMANLLKTKHKLDCGIIIGDTEKETKKEKDKMTEVIKNLILESFPLVYPKKKKLPEITVDANIKASEFKLIEEINEYRLANNQLPIVIAAQAKKMNELEIAKTKPVTVSNFQSLSAGYDDDTLSSIIFGSPLIGKVGVIQTIGRATRTNPNKLQDIPAHFMWSQFMLQYFPEMHWTLIRNIKVQYPTAKFHLENFPNT